jgi:hypothetical protein
MGVIISRLCRGLIRAEMDLLIWHCLTSLQCWERLINSWSRLSRGSIFLEVPFIVSTVHKSRIMTNLTPPCPCTPFGVNTVLIICLNLEHNNVRTKYWWHYYFLYLRGFLLLKYASSSCDFHTQINLRVAIHNMILLLFLTLSAFWFTVATRV